ncbi:MAG TPA: 3-dehydroquinate synthase [Pyrinomonadaceae bacterium]|nr:3-dehydroquinate synthase [Pyrinomonadaceae bacterium]
MGEAVRRVRVRLGAREGYEIEVGRGLLGGLGGAARGALSPHARRVAVVSHARVFGLYGERAARALREGGFAVSHWLMGEGERHKTLRTAERALAFLAASKLERADAVVALGGGVVGDLAGFASALYLRGVACMQVPTTLLAQIDSSVGGKTGVNTREGKNLVGAFHHPRAVLVDTDTLRTLPPRELTAGWCEAVKQGAAGDRSLFDETVRFLEDERRIVEDEKHRSAVRESSDDSRAERLARLIAAQCAFKARVVAGDEREDVSRTDARSRRILNLGHTIGHALEAATRYRRFRHGEAVGYGLMAAGEISVRLGLLAGSELESLRRAVRLAGRLPSAAGLDEDAILSALGADKKAVAGRVRWVLLERIGRVRIVDGREVTPRVVRASLRAALRPQTFARE